MNRIGIAISGSSDQAEVGDRKGAERAESDAMIDVIRIAGTLERCRVRIEAYRQCGIDEAILGSFARGSDGKSCFEATIRACAPDRSG